MTQKLILSIVLQDIIRSKEGMPVAGYWMYFYDKRSPTTLRNAYIIESKKSVNNLKKYINLNLFERKTEVTKWVVLY